MRKLTAPGICAVILCVAVGGAPAAEAGGGVEAVSALWTLFLRDLRAGDYTGAYARFSPESRAAFPYDTFLVEYGPLSLARELLLTEPTSFSASLDGDWAEIRFVAPGALSGRQRRLAVCFSRDNAGWNVVASRNEAIERAEAGIRGFLRRAAGLRGDPAPDRLLALAKEAEAERLPALKAYRVENVGGNIVAIPEMPGLRRFYIGFDGVVRSGQIAPASLAPTAPAVSPTPPTAPIPTTHGLPDRIGGTAAPAIAAPAPAQTGRSFAPPPALREPPPPADNGRGGIPGMPGELPEPENIYRGMPGEPAEPPIPPRDSGSGMRRDEPRRPADLLPDRIS